MLKYNKPCYTSAAALLLCLVMVIYVSPPFLIYDEQLHFVSVVLLGKIGMSRDFLTGMTTAVGPLYAILHLVSENFTGERVLTARMLNIVLCSTMIVALYCAMKNRSTSTDSALIVIGIPTLWVVTGMALTEIPAMCFIALGLWALSEKSHSLYGAALSGLAFGLATTARQPYFALPILTCVIFLVWRKWDLRHVIIHGLTALPLPIMIFWVWGGLVPPFELQQAHSWIAIQDAPGLGSMGFHIDTRTMVRSLGYAGFFAFILSPSLLRYKNKLALTAGALVFALNFSTNFLDFMPATHAIDFLPQFILTMLPPIISSLFASLAWMLFFGLAMWIWQYRQSAFNVTLGLAALGIVIHPGVIALEFSSRYTIMALPFLAMIASQEQEPQSPWRTLRLVGGAAIGILMLNSYYVSWTNLVNQGFHMPVPHILH